MLLDTFERVTKLFQEHNGYLSAAQLRNEKVTTIQIKRLVERGILEKISHGFYWLIDQENGKPKNYKMIEACMVNKRAVICADSACYYHKLTNQEPDLFSVATLKTDRSRMQLNFPVKRHYFSNLCFEQDIVHIDTKYGEIRVYDIERSVCDCIRFKEDIGAKNVDIIVNNYMESKDRQIERLLKYADDMRVGKIVRKQLGNL